MHGGVIFVWNRTGQMFGYEQAFMLPDGNEIKMGSR